MRVTVLHILALIAVGPIAAAAINMVFQDAFGTRSSFAKAQVLFFKIVLITIMLITLIAFVLCLLGIISN